MKVMKRIVVCLLAVCMVLALVACGDKEQTVVLSLEQSQSGVTIKGTTSLTAKGDKLQKSEETYEVDITSLDDETKDGMISLYHEMYTTLYDGIDAATITENTTDTTYTIKIAVDYSDISALQEAGLVTGGDYVSLKGMQDLLEGQGYTVVK